MKCTFCQISLEEDCDFCSNCGKEVVSTQKIVHCTGKKKNGSLCGAELQKGKNFCKKCGAKVDQSLFEKEVVLCVNCSHAFADDEDFCVDCGFPRNGISVSLAELKRGSESTSSRMETVKSCKFDQNQSQENAKNRKENQTSVAPVDKAHGTKSESEEVKSETSTMKLELEGKGSNITRTGNNGKIVGVVRVHYHSLVSAEFGLTSADVVVIRFGDEELGGWGSDAHGPELVRKSVNVTRVHFHSLVSAEFGLTSEDVVNIRFGDDELGGWKSDAYIPELVRKYVNGYTEFELVLDIPKKLSTRHRKIEYKYVIIKNKAHKDKAAKYMWEFYGKNRSLNRTLDLPDIKNIDKTFSVVSKSNPSLKMKTEFTIKGEVEMKWGCKFFSGVIVKISDNEALLKKFAKGAYESVVKSFKPKYEGEIPDDMFELDMSNNAEDLPASGKRKRKESEKLRVSKTQKKARNEVVRKKKE